MTGLEDSCQHSASRTRRRKSQSGRVLVQGSGQSPSCMAGPCQRTSRAAARPWRHAHAVHAVPTSEVRPIPSTATFRIHGVAGQLFCTFNNSVRITYDPAKRARTLADRDLDFEDALVVFEELAVEVEDPRKDYCEQRIIWYGTLEGRILVVRYSQRGPVCHIFSMRGANDREQTAWRRTSKSDLARVDAHRIKPSEYKEPSHQLNSGCGACSADLPQPWLNCFPPGLTDRFGQHCDAIRGDNVPDNCGGAE
jgi:uncharacterized protein